MKNKHGKKIIALMLVLGLIFGAAACKKADGGNTPEDDNKPSESDALKEETTAAYRAALETLLNEHKLPDGTDCGYDELTSSVNKFAITDIDGDGKDELIVLYTTTYSAGMAGCIYGYDAETKTLVNELYEYPMLTFYKNGAIAAGWSHAQGLSGDFWPYSVYQYDAATDTYKQVGMVDAWDKNLAAADSEGNAFPDDIDVSGTGFVYYLLAAGEYDYSNPVDKAQYDEWFGSYFGDGETTELTYTDLTAENIAAL